MRRIHLPEFSLGRTDLSDAQARYLRDVLRLTMGQEIEVFGQGGAVGHGSISAVGRAGVTIEITRIEPPRAVAARLSVAAAIPKAARADWMVEKLAELGVADFFPLATARGAVLPKGDKKFERWRRLAAEASRQSGRDTVMRIHSLATPAELMAEKTNEARWHLSVDAAARPILELLAAPPASLVLFVGPEGGWTPEESELFASAGIAGVRLTDTILRIETAAVAGAAIVATAQSGLTHAAPGATIGSVPHRNNL